MTDQGREPSQPKSLNQQRTLVVGATGRAGVATLRALLQNDRMRARALVRTVESAERKIPEELRAHPRFEMAVGSISEMSAEEIRAQTDECSHVVMALGHNGVFARPWSLVTDSHRRVVSAQAERRQRSGAHDERQRTADGGDPLRMVVLNSAAIPNPAGADTPQGFGSRAFLGLVSTLVPPLADSAACSRYICEEIGKDAPNVEWTVVRPGLFQEEEHESDVHENIQGSLLAPRSTSIPSLGKFMGNLCVNEHLWQTWRFKLPCIVDVEDRN